MKENLLKGRSFWHFKTPKNCTWGWRKLLKLKDAAKDFIHFDVAHVVTGIIFIFGSTVGTLAGKLYEKYGHHVIFEARSKMLDFLLSLRVETGIRGLLDLIRW